MHTKWIDHFLNIFFFETIPLRIIFAADRTGMAIKLEENHSRNKKKIFNLCMEILWMFFFFWVCCHRRCYLSAVLEITIIMRCACTSLNIEIGQLNQFGGTSVLFRFLEFHYGYFSGCVNNMAIIIKLN